MKKKIIIILLLAAMLALVFLAVRRSYAEPAGNNGINQEHAVSVTPAASLSPEKPDENNAAAQTAPDGEAVRVSSVDEFLAALAPDTVIELAAGTYDLSTASDYGRTSNSPYYDWQEVYSEDGVLQAELVLRNLNNLTLRGSDGEGTLLAAVPRYANVLAFSDCGNLSLSKLTLGHTEAPGFCSGGVLDFRHCEQVSVEACAMFGCGTMGVSAYNTTGLHVRDSEIYECSYGAVSANGCYDVLLSGCSIHDCGRNDPDFICFDLLGCSSTTGFAVVNCDIERNDANTLLNCDYSREVKLLGCGFSENRIVEQAFEITGFSPVVEGCSFIGNEIASYYKPNFSAYAVSAANEDLITFDFNRMQRVPAVYDGLEEENQPVNTESEGGEYHVKTTEEFLAAIGPNRTIVLEGEEFNLTEGAGGYGGSYYFWETGYDGPTLVISQVTDLRIRGLGKDRTTVLATPRYADVLRFEGCERISVSDLTAGHTESGECVGDVLNFSYCDDIQIKDCSLYGCGVWGIRTASCNWIRVEDCEIYGCSYGAVEMYYARDVHMARLNVHDMPDERNGSFYECEGIYLDDVLLTRDAVDLRR